MLPTIGKILITQVVVLIATHFALYTELPLGKFVLQKCGLRGYNNVISFLAIGQMIGILAVGLYWIWTL